MLRYGYTIQCREYLLLDGAVILQSQPRRRRRRSRCFSYYYRVTIFLLMDGHARAEANRTATTTTIGGEAFGTDCRRLFFQNLFVDDGIGVGVHNLVS